MELNFSPAVSFGRDLRHPFPLGCIIEGGGINQVTLIIFCSLGETSIFGPNIKILQHQRRTRSFYYVTAAYC